MSKVDLRLNWASHEAAEYACKRWHYSKRMPSFQTTKVGVWEDGHFIGVVIFSRGATPELGKPYNLKQTQICELTRVALRAHKSEVSKIVAIALRMLKKKENGLRLVVSFADTEQGHNGAIYQAGNWIYTGQAKTHTIYVNGKHEHPKTLHSRYGKGGQSIPWLRKNVDIRAKRVGRGGKHRYLMPLDDEMRRIIATLAKPYPKRTKHAMAETIGTAAVEPRPVRSICEAL